MIVIGILLFPAWAFAHGWFLLIPPKVGDGPDIDTGKPFLDWNHVGTYDSAKECERDRWEYTKMLMRVVVGDKKEGKKSDPFLFYSLNAYESGKCIPAPSLIK